MPPTTSRFLLGLSALASAEVRFVLVGVGGINFYARDPASAFATLDVDVLLEPDVDNLSTALGALSDVGFSFQAGGEPFLDTSDAVLLATVIRRGASLTALHEDGAMLDLMLSITGFSYEEVAQDAARFRAGDSELRVGRLEKLLRSKELSDRPKDREFLRHFEALHREDDD